MRISPRRFGAQASGQVGDRADGRVVKPAFESDAAQRGITHCDADAEVK
jgi:hypothetical protein